MSANRIAVWRERALRLWLTAGASAVTALGSIARNKWIALHLDPSGLGVLGQVVAGQTWLGTLTGLGLSVSVARAIGAERGRGETAAVRRTAGAALALVRLTTLAVAVAGLLFAPAASTALFGTPAHAMLVRISMLAVVGLGFQAVLSGVFAGHSDVRAPFTYALAGNVAMVALVVLLVPRSGLPGAVWGITLFWPAAIAVSLLAHRRTYAPVLPGPAEQHLDRTEVGSLVKVAIAGLVLALVDQGALLALRSHYVRVAGLAANGLLQASLGLSAQLGTIVYGYLASYAFGRVSGMRSAAEVRAYTRLQWGPLVALGVAGCAALGLLGTPVLHLLYSSRFDAARPMLVWMLVGELGRIGVQVWALGALPIGGVRLWVPIGLSGAAGLTIAYVIGVHAGAGALALPYAYAAAGGASLLVAGVLMSARGVTLRARDLALLLAGYAALIAIARVLGRA
jgi:O-antigen/teichoic acid export membrane protein